LPVSDQFEIPERIADIADQHGAGEPAVVGVMDPQANPEPVESWTAKPETSPEPVPAEASGDVDQGGQPHFHPFRVAAQAAMSH